MAGNLEQLRERQLLGTKEVKVSGGMSKVYKYYPAGEGPEGSERVVGWSGLEDRTVQPAIPFLGRVFVQPAAEPVVETKKTQG